MHKSNTPFIIITLFSTRRCSMIAAINRIFAISSHKKFIHYLHRCDAFAAARYKRKEVGRTRDALGAVGGICKCAWGTRRTGAAPGHIRVRTHGTARALAAANARFVFALFTLGAGAPVSTSISCITLTRKRGSRSDGRCRIIRAVSALRCANSRFEFASITCHTRPVVWPGVSIAASKLSFFIRFEVYSTNRII
jgi:hypothetical protein